MTSKPAYEPDALLYIGEAAELVGVHPETLRRWDASGRIPAHRTASNLRRFRVADLLAAAGLPPAQSEDAA